MNMQIKSEFSTIVISISLPAVYVERLRHSIPGTSKTIREALEFYWGLRDDISTYDPPTLESNSPKLEGKTARLEHKTQRYLALCGKDAE